MKITCKTGQVAEVSVADKDLSKYEWKFMKGYFYRKGEKGIVLLHREIIARKCKQQLTRSDFTDHIDHNRQNNKRSNLRLVTNAQNQANQKLRVDNKSGVKGVTRVVVKEKYIYWYAHIRYQGKKINLGHFKTLKEAKQARSEAETKYQGQYAYSVREGSIKGG